jgi:hypothetical protein
VHVDGVESHLGIVSSRDGWASATL